PHLTCHARPQTAAFRVDRAEHGHRLPHHQRALAHGDAAADRDGVALDHAAGLELDGPAHADHVSLDNLALLHGDVAAEDTDHVAVAVPVRPLQHLGASAAPG